jgi:DNA polymerase epsilon subunit 2
MLQYSPSGILSLYDPTGEIELDTKLTQPLPDENANWFVPGMFVILDGMYEEDGRFTVYTALSPPLERREASAEIFGHVDFLGNGVSLDMSSPSGGGQQGRMMRKVELALTHIRWVAIGEVTLDQPKTLEALRKLFEKYSKEPPMLFILSGNFSSVPVAPGDNNAIRGYKENFDALASLLVEFPMICMNSTLLFVPGDHDPWASAFSGGSTAAWPRKAVPEVFLNRVKRVANHVKCASSPCRLGYFTSEVVVCRDDIVGRLQRTQIRFAKPAQDDEMEVDGTGVEPTQSATQVDDDTKLARKLVKTILDQGYLSPFPGNKRPVLWDFAHTLGLYPLPSAVCIPTHRDGYDANKRDSYYSLSPSRRRLRLLMRGVMS